MGTPYLGQISMFGGNFAPKGWAMCNGQQMSIAQNQALFSLLGTTYGGNGVSTFNLPNLVSRLPVDVGTGPGLSTYVLGQSAGVDSVTLTAQTMPAHTHMLNASQAAPSANPTGSTVGNTVVPAKPASPALFYASQPSGQPVLTFYTLAPGAVSTVGQNQPHTNMMPSLCITFIIALQGAYPSRS